ncbi:AzlC family ABC transporter permease [Streptomyces ficellus]|uniref:Branched-chain amino acid ABC transporter permease n=1 Tax=Streptomyces ficellus TaxID=1977088 RepID=A0A6I6FLF4_9ACTN|nr:AzlC family ABC transporter permease [Streptomyces ficellus]QGV80135.1 branched-chain amino acid ABC transporter permease [Streptomyces ficellus]
MTTAASTPTVNPRPSRAREMRRGAVSSVGVVVGAIPFALLTGAVSQQSGLSLLETMLLSALVNAGSAQMVGIGMLAAGAAWPLVVLTTLVINARHVFYSASLSPYVKHLSPAWRAAIAHGMTDAVYALAAKRYREDPDPRGFQHWNVMAASLAVYAAWLSATMAGWIYGKDLSGIDGLGLDFAIYATYIGLVVSCFTSVRAVAIGLLAGALSLALHQLPYQSGLFCSTMAAAVVAGWWEGKVRGRDLDVSG